MGEVFGSGTAWAAVISCVPHGADRHIPPPFRVRCKRALLPACAHCRPAEQVCSLTKRDKSSLVLGETRAKLRLPRSMAHHPGSEARIRPMACGCGESRSDQDHASLEGPISECPFFFLALSQIL